jgi:hypothetical protein
MNPMHRDTGRSVGLHLFQELSTLGQQLAHTLLLLGRGGRESVFTERAAISPALRFEVSSASGKVSAKIQSPRSNYVGPIEIVQIIKDIVALFRQNH